eukprot:8899116-Ditylum_brightwellii.AAC.1
MQQQSRMAKGNNTTGLGEDPDNSNAINVAEQESTHTRGGTRASIEGAVAGSVFPEEDAESVG